MGNSISPKSFPDLPNLRLVASQTTWIEGAALEQLKTVARLPGVELAVGFPDLHPGKGFPVGAAFVTRDVVYPLLAGNDIGCAMSLWATDLSRRKLKLDRWAGRLDGLDRPWDGDVAAWRECYDLPESPSDAGLGTIGGGNHFAELQVVAEVRDADAMTALGLDEEQALLLIHSGSRGLGDVIHRQLLAEHGADPLADGSPEADRYAARHGHAMRFAAASRALLAHRFAGQIGATVRLVSDVPHNTVTREDWQGAPAWVHRKGAASARHGAFVIPGSRGTPSYLVAPTGDLEGVGWSLAHGAGRRWQRGYAKPRLSHKYRVEDLERTRLGGRVICEDRELLYEEAPQAYKDIGQVIGDLEAAGLVSVIAVLSPLLTYKVRRCQDD
ncbi:MAG: RNA ligase RtcB family protein [Hyphomicrobiaceae bacterium]